MLLHTFSYYRHVKKLVPNVGKRLVKNHHWYCYSTLLQKIYSHAETTNKDSIAIIENFQKLRPDNNNNNNNNIDNNDNSNNKVDYKDLIKQINHLQ